ncbi:MAG: sialidase family protein [Bacteroidales bacterium]
MRWLTTLVLAMACLAGPGHDGASAVLVTEFIADPSPTPQCHASTIVETASGLVAAWFGGEHERHPGVSIFVSRQLNGRWRAPVAVADGRQSDARRYPTWNPVLFKPRAGPLMLFYKVGPDPASWWGMLTTSGDDGRTWSGPQRLPDGILGPIKNKPVQLPGGDILCGSSTESPSWTVHFERTPDLGKTWERVSPAKGTAEIDAIQPALLIHGDGRVQAVGRTRQDRVFTTQSADGGHTWGALALLDLPNPNSGLDAVTLADGRFLLVYNHAASSKGDWSAGRGVLNVALSADGTAWQPVLVLESQPGQEFSYPAVIQAHDGLVHITYTWKRQKIRHVVLDPRRLPPLLPGR